MSCNIEIYTKKNCPYCNKAKEFFTKKLLDFKEISVDRDLLHNKYLEMYHRSHGQITVPQIFINNHHIGGADDLFKMSNNNPDKLNSLLYNKLTE